MKICARRQAHGRVQFENVIAHILAVCAHVHAQIFTDLFLAFNAYHLRLLLGFRKEPCKGLEDIQFLVTM